MILPLAEPGRWWMVAVNDPRARRLADRHYSRQTPGAEFFTPPGRRLVLLTDDERAVWAAVENFDPSGARQWRVSLFRNEGAGLSSTLIREATNTTTAYWSRSYGALPSVPLRTEVDARRTRPKRDPGRCFLRAGWLRPPAQSARATARGFVVLVAPGELERLAP